MRIHIGTDHAGYETKNALVALLRAKGHEVTDHGALSYESEDDRLMLRHEMIEHAYMLEGMTYHDAHRQANKSYNYEKYVLQLDIKAGIR